MVVINFSAHRVDNIDLSSAKRFSPSVQINLSTVAGRTGLLKLSHITLDAGEALVIS